MNQEKFDPSNPEYKKVEDLPQEHQVEFVNIEGGFVRKEAMKELKEAEVVAKGYSDDRPFMERITGKNKTTALDILKNQASWHDFMRGEDLAEFERMINQTIMSPNTSVEDLEDMLKYLLGKRPRWEGGKQVGWGYEISKQQESRIREEIEKRKK